MKKLVKLSSAGQRRLWRLLAIIVIVTVVLAVPTFFWMRDANQQLARRHNSVRSPLIMVPGSSAGQNRFDRLVEKVK